MTGLRQALRACVPAICLVTLGLTSPAASTESGLANLAPGGWIGWAYLGEGGDLPLRIWIIDEGDRTVVRFDGVAWKKRGWSARLNVQDGVVALNLATPKGTPIQLSGAPAERSWSGTIDFGEHSGEFELLHAPGLADIDPDTYADVAGYYRMSDGDVLEARALSWGEIVLRSIRTGEQRTLLPAAKDRFTTGPARYVPAPVESRYTVVRNSDSDVVELVCETANGELTRGTVFQLLTEPITIAREADVRLAGTITKPSDGDVHSGVVVLGGSAWQTQATHDFDVRNLAALGFAVIHWDKRGYGESGGVADVPFATTAADANAAALLLRSRDEIESVGYFGVSRGGWFGPLAVSKDNDAAFLIMIVPPATSPAKQEQDARLQRLRNDGYNDHDIALAKELLEATWRFVAEDTDDNWATYQRLFSEAYRREFPDYVFSPNQRHPGYWRWARMNMLYDPLPTLRKVHVPVLAIFGELDVSVLTSVNHPLMVDALRDAGNDDVHSVVIPGVPHSLARAWGSPHHRTTGIGPEGFDEVLLWSRKHRLIP